MSAPDARISVLVVDDHPVLRDIIKMACDGHPRLEVVGEAANGPDAVKLCVSLQPDVMVLDLMLPGMNGPEVAKRVKEGGCKAKILVLTGRSDPRAVFDSVRAKADGYLDKTTAITTIVDAIEAVFEGRSVFTEDQRRQAFTQLGRFVRQARDSSRAAATLTGREVEVLRLMGEGLTTRQMARRLGVSERTVESHISNTYKKLDVESRVQAVAKGIELGFIGID